jgi:hypothetical protein
MLLVSRFMMISCPCAAQRLLQVRWGGQQTPVPITKAVAFRGIAPASPKSVVRSLCLSEQQFPMPLGQSDYQRLGRFRRWPVPKFLTKDGHFPSNIYANKTAVLTPIFRLSPDRCQTAAFAFQLLHLARRPFATQTACHSQQPKCAMYLHSSDTCANRENASVDLRGSAFKKSHLLILETFRLFNPSLHGFLEKISLRDEVGKVKKGNGCTYI